MWIDIDSLIHISNIIFKCHRKNPRRVKPSPYCLAYNKVSENLSSALTYLVISTKSKHFYEELITKWHLINFLDEL